MKKLNIIVFISLLFLFSYNKKEKNKNTTGIQFNTSPKNTNSIANIPKKEKTNTSEEEEKAEEKPEVVELLTTFSSPKGHCINKETGDKELENTDKLIDCADLSDLNLEEYDLTVKDPTYYSTNMKGSDLSQNEVPYNQISWYEVLVDETTLFPLKDKKLINQFKKSHKNTMSLTGKEKSARNKIVKKLNSENKKIKKRLKKEKKTLSEDEFKSLSTQYNDNKEKIAELKLENKNSNRKKSRHKKYIKKIVK